MTTDKTERLNCDLCESDVDILMTIEGIQGVTAKWCLKCVFNQGMLSYYADHLTKHGFVEMKKGSHDNR